MTQTSQRQAPNPDGALEGHQVRTTRTLTEIRAAAFAIDLLLALVIPFAVGGYLMWNTAGWPLLLPLVPFAYLLFGNSTGRTVGKVIFGLTIVAYRPDDGDPNSRNYVHGNGLGLGRGLIRTVVGSIGFLALGVGYLWALWDKERRTWHDHAAGTSVVKMRADEVRQ